MTENRFKGLKTFKFNTLNVTHTGHFIRYTRLLLNSNLASQSHGSSSMALGMQARLRQPAEVQTEH